jgi:hypothetical protein
MDNETCVKLPFLEELKKKALKRMKEKSDIESIPPGVFSSCPDEATQAIILNHLNSGTSTGSRSRSPSASKKRLGGVKFNAACHLKTLAIIAAVNLATSAVSAGASVAAQKAIAGNNELDFWQETTSRAAIIALGSAFMAIETKTFWDEYKKYYKRCVNGEKITTDSAQQATSTEKGGMKKSRRNKSKTRRKTYKK